MFIAKDKVDFLNIPVFSPEGEDPRFSISWRNKPQLSLNSTQATNAVLRETELLIVRFVFGFRARADFWRNKSLSKGFSTGPYARMNSSMPSHTEHLSLKWMVEAVYLSALSNQRLKSSWAPICIAQRQKCYSQA